MDNSNCCIYIYIYIYTNVVLEWSIVDIYLCDNIDEETLNADPSGHEKASGDSRVEVGTGHIRQDVPAKAKCGMQRSLSSHVCSQFMTKMILKPCTDQISATVPTTPEI